jgi:dCMP deaminase
MNRPEWDDYFVSLAFLLAGRSIDSQTKHAAVAVANDKTILAIGFNSAPRGMNDDAVPVTRPYKYPYMIHAEIAMMANAAKHGIRLEGSTVYLTGHSCGDCFRALINCGIKKVIFGPQNSACVDTESKKVIEHMNQNKQIEIQHYVGKGFIDFLENRTNFVKSNFS